ncbi:MAG: hypothetical protein JSU74_05820 [Candidatus Zixiibacteriota bacterium]|nr:MAG: hypothetical protein JSU74_05820 [candidate division Zixibacteria bacterium]
MRQLVLLVCMFTAGLAGLTRCQAGIIPSLEAPSGKLGFYPISNEVSFYKNVDDAAEDRGETLQIISINSFRLWTTFNFEFTGDFNFDCSYDPEVGDYIDDHYIELSIVKPVTSFVSLNVQRIISTFEPEPVNQFGVRLVF